MPSPTQGHHRSWLDSRLILFAILFLVSGAAGLIYEIVWERLLELYFGVTMIAITLIVSAYMAGLGLGSLVGGRLAHRVKSPLPVYGLIEIAIGLFGLFSPALFSWVGQATAGSPYLLVFTLSFLLLLIPTVLMGMTLPLLSQAFIDRVDISGRVIGLLYGINTLGAAAGAALAGYLLIGASGLDGATHFAVWLNILIGIFAILIGQLRLQPSAAPAAAAGAPAKAGMRWGYRSVLLASFLTGFLGLGYEMLWIRLLHITNKSTAYSFPTILAIFLGGLAVGGYAWGRRADRTPDPVSMFVKIELAVGILAAASILVFHYATGIPAMQAWLTESFNTFQQPPSPMTAPLGEYVFSRRLLLQSMLAYLPPMLLMILPASLLMGGGLPVLDRIAIESPEIAGRRVGDIHLANILGSVAGSLAISFILLPAVGSEWTLRLLMLLSLSFLLIYLANLPKVRLPRLMWAGLALALTLIALVPGRGQVYIRLFEAATGGDASVRETGETVLALTRHDASRDDLWIGGEENSFFPTMGLWEGQALTCAAASRPQRVLVIGYGGGHTTYFFARLPGVETITVVELIPGLIPFLEEQVPFTAEILADPRLQVIADDGRRYLYAHPELTYDLIIIDPLRNYTAGHNNLYSLEALQLYRQHLTPGGVFCVWHDEYHIIPRTIAGAFPYVDQFGDFTIAGKQPLSYAIEVIEGGAAAFLAGNQEELTPAVATYLVPSVLLGGFVRDQDQILCDETETPLLEDLHPRLEYYINNLPALGQVCHNPAVQQEFLERLSGCDQACQDAILNR